MMLPVSRPFAAPPPVVPSAAPVKLTAKALPKPATKPTPQPAAASVSRREAPKRRLLSTHVNAWFNSPDKVQMYYEDAKYGNVWKAFGQWGSTWPGINERDLNPSETSPNGGTRFKVENKTTGQSFIVDKSNATFTALPDGKTRIAIEDRPGTKTPGSDIVLLLEPKFVTVKPAQTTPVTPTQKGRRLLQAPATTRAIEQHIRVFEDLRQPWAKRRAALNEVFLQIKTGDADMKKVLLGMQTGIIALRDGLPRNIYARLGQTLRNISRPGFIGSVQGVSNARANCYHFTNAKQQSLGINLDWLRKADATEVAGVMAHEMAHLAFEEMGAGSVSSALVNKPEMKRVIAKSADQLKIGFEKAKTLLKFGLSEQLVDDVCSRLTIGGKPIKNHRGDSKTVAFTPVLTKRLPMSFKASPHFSGLLTQAATSPKWKDDYNRALADAWAQPWGYSAVLSAPGLENASVVGSDSWMTACIKMQQFYWKSTLGSDEPQLSPHNGEPIDDGSLSGHFELR